MKRFLLVSISWIFFIASPSWGVDFKWLSVHNGLLVDRFNIDEPYTGEITGEIVGQAKDGRLVGVATVFVSNGKIRCKQFPNNCEVFATNGNLLASADNFEEAVSFLDSKKKAAENASVASCEQKKANWRAAAACRNEGNFSARQCMDGDDRRPPPCIQYWSDKEAGRAHEQCIKKWGPKSVRRPNYYIFSPYEPSC